ncbi:MAG: ATP-binding cassette domain-containing protein [Halodesulfurarchaeum sp.]
MAQRPSRETLPREEGADTGRDPDDAIRTVDLELTYSDGTTAVDGITLSVPRGAFFGFLGPNGAGKTTFIEILVTLLHPTAGSVEVNGFDLEADPQAIRETIGYMAQETSVDGELTARENLRFACAAYGVPTEDREERIETLLSLVELEDVAEKPAEEFSGGMKKRLDAATALVHDPPLVFLDEPTTGLDPKSRNELWRYFERINERGQTIFLTTQYLEEANALCDSLAVIQDGQIIASGTPSELKARVGGYVLGIEFGEEGQTDRAASILRNSEKMPAETAIEVTDGGLSITGPNIQTLAVDLLGTLIGHDLEIERFELHEPTLDDVFLTLTGEQLDADEIPAEGER